MATLALSIVGNALLPGIGGFIGAAAGAALDQLVIFPTLFPPPSQQGPRLADRSVQMAADGSDGKFVLGPHNRVAGTVIFASDLIEEEDEAGGGKKAGSVTLYKYFVDLAIHLCDTKTLPGGRIEAVRDVWGFDKPIFADGAPIRCESITVYDGSQTTPDPMLEEYLGAGKVPHYKNSAVLVIKRLALEDFGNTVPNITARVSQSRRLTIADAARRLAVRAGMSDDEIDTELAAGCLFGYVSSGPQSGADMLAPVVQAGFLLVAERGTAVSFISRGYEDVVAVDGDELSAAQGGSPAEFVGVERTRVRDEELPREVVVKFTSTLNNLQQGAERERRPTFGGTTQLNMELPLTLKPGQGKAIAKSTLWATEAERESMRVSLPPSFVSLQEGDVLALPDGSRMLVRQVDRGANWVIEARGVSYEPTVYAQSASGSEAFSTPTQPSAVRLEWVVFDAAATSDALAETTGLYVAACVANARTWQGAAAFSSPTADGQLTQRKQLEAEASIWRVDSPPNWAQGTPFEWDAESRVVVTPLGGSDPVACTEQECMNGSNVVALVDDAGAVEFAAFSDVADNGDGSFTLSNWLRCLRGTQAVRLPTKAVRMNAAVAFVSDASLLNGAEYWRVAAAGASADAVAPRLVACAGLTRTPSAPTHLRAALGPDASASFDSCSSSAADQTITRSAGFGQVAPGQHVTLGGSSDPTRNVSWLVVSRPSATTLELQSSGATLGDETGLSAAAGHSADLRVSWSRRGRRDASMFSSPPLASDENPERYRVRVYTGGRLAVPRREQIVDAERWTYGSDERAADGVASLSRVVIEVAQLSSVVGVGRAARIEVAT